jgi:predicted glutamine amidotransferase
MEDIIRYCSSSGVAHVRRGSSGPTGGIPDPHPFRRKCVNRNIEFLLAHNGTIPIFTLMDLIQTINPLYLDTNPPDYSPDYIDSDLYSIYLAEVLDTYFDSTVESCIRIAVVKLDSALNTASGEMNFVMSDGNAMLVLNYTLDPIEAITAYYSPDTASSDFWAAASEPLDTFSGSWVEIPNKTLVTLKPGEAPVFTRICRVSGDMPLQTGGCAVSARTVPFNRTLLISYRVPRDSPVVLAIHDSAGRLVRTLVAGIRKEGEYTASWDGTDDAGKTLASGTYFCLLKAGDQEAGLKTILAR